MENYTYGIVGIGKLGKAMMKYWAQHDLPIGVYHPNKEKITQFIDQYKNGYLLTKEDISKVSYLNLALPAHACIPFIESLDNVKKDFTIINMATNVDTDDLKNAFPYIHFVSMKFMGHSKDLADNGNGLFVTEDPITDPIQTLFNPVGEVIVGDPSVVQEVNKLATYYAVKSSLQIEEEFLKKKYSRKFIKRALESIAPQVMRSYSNDSLGHFGQQIADEIKKKN
jgi:pyrroline-5-carboxylate reductase